MSAPAGECVYPQLPDITDVHKAQQAAWDALEAGAPDEQYTVLAAARQQTETAFLRRLDREYAAECEAGT